MITNARKLYYEYVKEGIGQGRRPELVGGGLIRSLGGWDVIKKSGLKSIGRVKGMIEYLVIVNSCSRCTKKRMKNLIVIMN